MFRRTVGDHEVVMRIKETIMLKIAIALTVVVFAASCSSGSNSNGAAGQTTGPHVVSSCAGATVRTWEQMQLPADATSTLALVMDPNDYATLYVGTVGGGIFKTTDCGATWNHINNPTDAGSFDPGMEGSMAIDPTNPNTLFADNRYGIMGLFESTNAGADWSQILPPDIAQVFVDGGMIEWIAADPTDHLHLIVSPHFTCVGSHTSSCLLETEDGGTSWHVIDGTPESDELGGQVILDKKTWLWMGGNGLWRTSDQGVSWTEVYQNTMAYPSVYHAKDNSIYVPSSSGLLHSTDGINWSVVPNSPPMAAFAVSDTTFYAANGLNATFVSSAPLADLTTWTTMPKPGGDEGAWMMQYDGDHHFLYTSDFASGLWRLATQ